MSIKWHSETKSRQVEPARRPAAATASGAAGGWTLEALTEAGNGFMNQILGAGSSLVEEASSTLSAAESALFGAGPEQEQTEGSAIVLGSAVDSEVAYDDSFTPLLIDQLDENPEQSVAEILRAMSEQVLDVPLAEQPVHHATMASYGDETANQGDGENARSSVFVANSDYVHIDDLQTPGPEARALEGQLASRGYDSAGVHEDLAADAMHGVYGRLVAGAEAGDELFAYFAGHGAPEGFVGTWHEPGVDEDILSYGDVTGLVSQATSRGAHIHVVIDACHSGAGAQAVREERRNDLAELDIGLLAQGGLLVAEYALDAKQLILDHLAARAERPDVLKPIYLAIEAQYEPLRAEFETVFVRQPPADDESDEAVLLRAELDAELATLSDRWQAVGDQLVALDEHAAWDAWRAAWDERIARRWRSWIPAMTAAGLATGAGFPPLQITDFNTLGAQVAFLDDIQNGAAEPAERAVR